MSSEEVAHHQMPAAHVAKPQRSSQAKKKKTTKQAYLLGNQGKAIGVAERPKTTPKFIKKTLLKKQKATKPASTINNGEAPQVPHLALHHLN